MFESAHMYGVLLPPRYLDSPSTLTLSSRFQDWEEEKKNCVCEFFRITALVYVREEAWKD